MSKNKNFRNKWRTLTEIGQVLGLSAIKVGTLLKETGLRNSNGDPTNKSKEENFVHIVESKNNKTYFLWDGKKIILFFKNNKNININFNNGITYNDSLKLMKVKEIFNGYKEATKLLKNDEDKMAFMYYDSLEVEIKEHNITNELFQKLLTSLKYCNVSYILDNRLSSKCFAIDIAIKPLNVEKRSSIFKLDIIISFSVFLISKLSTI